VSGLPTGVGAAVRDSIGSATVASSHLPGETGAAVIAAARQAFVAGMSSSTSIGAVIVAVGAVMVVVWMPNRRRTSDSQQVDDASADAAAYVARTA
jgi:DHA2 family multidrug resistance protein-like MFS transporter